MRRCWVNFQCRGILPIWNTVGQGHIALTVGAGRVLWTFFVASINSFLSPYQIYASRTTKQSQLLHSFGKTVILGENVKNLPHHSMQVLSVMRNLFVGMVYGHIRLSVAENWNERLPAALRKNDKNSAEGEVLAVIGLSQNRLDKALGHRLRHRKSNACLTPASRR